MYNVFSKLILFFFVLFLICKSPLALEDGKYTGVYKLTYCHAWSDSKKGDTGIFEISVKNETNNELALKIRSFLGSF